MRNVTPDNISEVFAGYFGDDTDPRFKEVMSALARHLHEFTREVSLTHDEWRAALKAMEWAGNITTPERNEFVLLSDVLGLSSLVDMINSPDGATSSSVLGPFHVSDAPPMQIGEDMKRHYSGEVLLVQGRVQDLDGNPVPFAKLDIWQTAPNGLYSSQDSEQDIMSFHGLMTADENGYYGFTTVRPVVYTVPTDGPVGSILNAAGRHPWRPSHLHFIIKADGYRDLVTEVFPDDDPYLDQDTVFGVREDLVMCYEQKPSGTFPEGFAISGKVNEAYLAVNFDFKLVAK